MRVLVQGYQANNQLQSVAQKQTTKNAFGYIGIFNSPGPQVNPTAIEGTQKF